MQIILLSCQLLLFKEAELHLIGLLFAKSYAVSLSPPLWTSQCCSLLLISSGCQNTHTTIHNLIDTMMLQRSHHYLNALIQLCLLLTRAPLVSCRSYIDGRHETFVSELDTLSGTFFHDCMPRAGKRTKGNLLM